MNWKWFGKERPCPNRNNISGYLPGATEGNLQKSQSRLSIPVRDPNWGPQEYDSRTLSLSQPARFQVTGINSQIEMMTCQIGTCIFQHNKNWMKETSVRRCQHWLAQKQTLWKILTPHAMLAVVPLQHGFAHTSDPIHFATNNNYFTSHGQAISVTVLKMHVWALHYFLIQTQFNTRDCSHAPCLSSCLEAFIQSERHHRNCRFCQSCSRNRPHLFSTWLLQRH